jgi:hypothetical protein
VKCDRQTENGISVVDQGHRLSAAVDSHLNSLDRSGMRVRLDLSADAG